MLAVLLVNQAPPASADHGRDTEVWSATLRLADTSPTGNTGLGCSDLSGTSTAYACSNTAVLNDREFTYLNVNYPIDTIVLTSTGISIDFSSSVTDQQVQVVKALTLHIGSNQYDLADFDAVLTNLSETELTLPSLSAGQTVQLKLVRQYWTGVDLYGGGLVHDAEGYQDLEITSESGSNTFMVRLDQAPTANVTITLQKNFTQCSGCGKTYHGDVNAATVSPTTLTFTTSNWQTGQTVTVTAVPDSDSVHEHLGIWAFVSIASGADANDPYRSPDRVNGVWVTIWDGADGGGNHGGL